MERTPYIEVLTNLSCNLRCKYCFEHHKNTRVNDIQAVKDYLHAVFRLDYDDPNTEPFSRSENARLNLIGGEPFLCTSLMNQTIEEWLTLNEQYGLPFKRRASIITNGTLINEDHPEVIRFLERWKDYIHPVFSIDGSKYAHDSYRVDMQGRGSYDTAIQGYHIAREIVGNDNCGVKGTFSHATIPYYSEGVINLIQEGFKNINCNTVFEENWTDEEADQIAPMFDPIIDYILDHNLQDDVNMVQLKHNPEDMIDYCKFCNKCSCYSVGLCLGLDRQIYGCHRTAAADDPEPWGHLEGDQIIIDRKKLPETMLNMWKTFPKKCLECGLGFQCAMCASAIYHYSPDHDPQQYHDRFSQCGWTLATYAAKLAYKERLEQIKEVNNKNEANKQI